MIMEELWDGEWRERLGNSREAKVFGRGKKIPEDYDTSVARKDKWLSDEWECFS